MTALQSRLDVRPAWAALALIAGAASAEALLFAAHGAHLPPGIDTPWQLLFNSAWSWWVHVDRRKHRLGYPFEFDALVFLAWPVVAPCYLLRSRASRSRRATLCVWLLYVLPFLAAGICFMRAGQPLAQ